MAKALIEQDVDKQPWFKEPWPWILMAGPFIAMIGCAITIVLALQPTGVSEEISDGGVKRGLVVTRDGATKASVSETSQ